MLVNHLIVGTYNLKRSEFFYCQILDFEVREAFVDTGTGNTGSVLTKAYSPSVLLVPLRSEMLPCPQHLAFEVDDNEFNRVLNRCSGAKITIRGEPSLNSNMHTVTDHIEHGVPYRHFYFCDPSGVNIEIMLKRGQ